MKPPTVVKHAPGRTAESDADEGEEFTSVSEWTQMFCDYENPKGFLDFILGEDTRKDRVRQVTKALFKFADTLAVTLPLLATRIKKIRSDAQMWNTFVFLQNIPGPTARAYPLFEDKGVVNISAEHRLAHIEKCWLELIALDLPASLLRKSVPFLVDSLLPHMPNGQLFGDFLFKLFDRGQIFSVLSLAGIFHLIIHHNFEYPDFYSVVYSLLNSYVCYSTYAQRFFELIDQFLRSSHVPNYIVASYVKRLARLLLTAPTPLQTPIITLLRNVLSRHPDLAILVHRDSPMSLEADPYDENEKDLKKSNALDSSLWELKAIKNHWHPSVSKKATAAETVVRTELETKWPTDDEIFERMFARKFGHELPEHGVIEEEEENSSDETELRPPKKKAKGIAFVEMHRRVPANKKGKNDVPSNFVEPSATFLKSFPQGAINFDAVWKL